MLLSMTGFGEARAEAAGFAVGVEVRAVNNRYLKLTVRGSDPYPLIESEIEKVVRRHVKRGTLHVTVRVTRSGRAAGLELNTDALAAYVAQIEKFCHDSGHDAVAPALLSGVLALPGVAPEPGGSSGPPEDEWPVVEKTIEAALARLTSARKDEGRAMATELMLHHRHIHDRLALIKEHLPKVMEDFRQRLLDRIRQAVADAGVTVTPDHLIRELALYADRTDVSEEVTRLDAHLVQFEEIVRTENDGPGRRLEFVIQEMGRETNTLGSKAGDVALTRHVVEIKATMEKIRELVLNVE